MASQHPAWDRAFDLTRRDLLRYGGALGATVFAGVASAAYPAAAAGAPTAGREPARSAVGVSEHVVIYKTVNGLSLELHVWTPAGWAVGQRHAAVVFYHGGGWRGGGWEAFQSQSAYLAGRGLVAISVHYRRSGPVIATLDGVDAMNYVFEHAAELGIDRERIVAAGGSAGGEIALATLRDDLPNSVPTNRPSATILFNPVTNTTGDYPVGWGRYQFADDAQAEMYSPFHHILPGDPPALIMHGTSDTTVSFDNATAFVETMRDVGNDATLVSYDDEKHAFFNATQYYNRYFYETVREADRFLVSLGYLTGVPTIRPTPPEAVENGGFEQGLNGWSASPGSMERIVHSPVHGGTLAAAVAGRSGSGVLSHDVTDDVLDNGPGEYLLRAWSSAATDATAEVSLSLRVKGTDDAQHRSYSIPSATIPGEGYIQVSGTRNVSWSGRLESARMECSVTSGEAYLDDVSAQFLPARIGWWRFADGSGDVLADSSGFGLDGALAGGTWITERPVGGAVRLDGSDRIDLPNLVDPGTTDFVVRLRLRLDEPTQALQTIVRPSDSAAGSWLSWDPTTSRLVSEIGGTPLVSELTLPVRTWIRVALVRAGDTVELYIEDELAATRSGVSLPSARSSMLIGAPAADTEFEGGLHGAIADISFWDHVPTSE